MKTLTVATTNPGKTHEVRLALDGLRGWIVETLPAGFPEIEESGATFTENATLKALHYSRLVDGFTLADDSGLCVKALDNRPGIYTARFGATTEARNQRVLRELAELEATAESNRDAEFHCVFVVARSGSVIWSTEAQLPGQIALEPIGSLGFGFDPIFFLPGLRKTLAQLTTEDKNRVSARGQALADLRRFLTLQ